MKAQIIVSTDNKLEIYLRNMSCIAERALSMALIIEAVYKEFNFPYKMIGPVDTQKSLRK